PGAAARARRIVSRALAAHGGAARIRAVRDIVLRDKVVFASAGGAVDGEMAMTIKLPDKSRLELSLLGQRGVQVLNGSAGWTSSGGKIEDLSATQVQSMRVGLEVQVLPLLAHLSDPNVKLGYLGEERVAGAPADVVH